MPGEMQIRVGHGIVNNPAAFAGDVGVLAAEDHQHLAFDFADAIEAVVFHAFAQGTLVDVGGVKTGCGENILVHGGAEGEVAADADADGAELASAVISRLKMSENR